MSNMERLALRDYQKDAVDATWKFLKEKQGNPLIVVPTGGGKSLIIAELVQRVTKFPDARVLILQHRKELIQQNFEKISSMIPINISVGICSASLGQKKLHAQVTIAGIQSIYTKGGKLPRVDLVLIDEAHLLPPEGTGMYQTLLKSLAEQNSECRVVGLTATPFRTTSGSLTDDAGLFSDIVYDIPLELLIEREFLTPIVSKRAVSTPETSQIKKRGKEFISAEAEKVFDCDLVTKAAIQEMERLAGDRKSILVFASGVKHAEHFAEALRKSGVHAESVTGETLFRDQHLDNFRRAKLRVLVSVDILTTGFDAPNIDCIVVLRPTGSPGLFVQMVGRGLRLSAGKKNCLLLDFAGNLERHGPIDGIKIVKKSVKNADGTFSENSVVESSPAKVCPECQEALGARAEICKFCGYVFPVKVKHERSASDSPVMKGEKELRDHDITTMEFLRHEKHESFDSFKINYYEANKFKPVASDYLCFEHSGYAKQKAHEKWKQLSTNLQTPAPSSVTNAIFRAGMGELKTVDRIRVKREGSFWRVVGVRYGQCKIVVREDSRPKVVLSEEEEDDLPF